MNEIKPVEDQSELDKIKYYTEACFKIIDRIKSEKNAYAISRAIDGLQDFSIWSSAAVQRK